MLRSKEMESPPPTFQPAQVSLRKRIRPTEPFQRHQRTLRTCLQRNPETSVKTITDQRVTRRLGIFGNIKQSEPALRMVDMPAPIMQRMHQDIQRIVNSVRCERAHADERHWAFATAIAEQQQPVLEQKKDDDRARQQPRLDRPNFTEAEAGPSTMIADCNASRLTTHTAGDNTHRSAGDGRRRSTFARDPPLGEIAERILKVVPFVPLQQGKGETYSTAAHRLIFTKYTETNSALLKAESTEAVENDSPASVAADDQSPTMSKRPLDQTPEELLTAVSELNGWDNPFYQSSSTAPSDWTLNNEPRSPLTMHNEFVFRSPYRPNFSRAQSPLSSSPISSVGTQPFSLDESFGTDYKLYSIMGEFEPLVGSPPHSPPPPPVDDFNRRTPRADTATSLVLF